MFSTDQADTSQRAKPTSNVASSCAVVRNKEVIKKFLQYMFLGPLFPKPENKRPFSSTQSVYKQ